MAVQLISADVVVPVAGAAIDDGAVAIEGGRVVEVGTRRRLRTEFPEAEERHHRGVVTPGLVNAHTHLQFTSFAEIGRQIHDGFEEWSVVFDRKYGQRAPREDWYGAVLAGGRLALATGTTTVAEISTDFEAVPAVREAGLGGVVYLEALGHTWDAWEGGERARYLAALEDALSIQDDRVRIGVSPHAPYSLDTDVLTDMAAIARDRGMRVHTHLGESAYEDEYCMFATGPLADFVRGFGRGFQIVVEGGCGVGTVEFSHRIGLLGPDTHVAHGIYLDEPGRALLRELDIPVALCPRSNEVIGLKEPPVAAYLREGNPVAVGTDSLASSPSLDLLEDVAVLYRLAQEQGYDEPDLAERLFRAATRGGAYALGLDHPEGVGALAPGRQADIAVFDMAVTADHAVEALVREGAGRCVATYVGGEAMTVSTESS